MLWRIPHCLRNLGRGMEQWGDRSRYFGPSNQRSARQSVCIGVFRLDYFWKNSSLKVLWVTCSTLCSTDSHVQRRRSELQNIRGCALPSGILWNTKTEYRLQRYTGSERIIRKNKGVLTIKNNFVKIHVFMQQNDIINHQEKCSTQRSLGHHKQFF